MCSPKKATFETINIFSARVALSDLRCVHPVDSISPTKNLRKQLRAGRHGQATQASGNFNFRLLKLKVWEVGRIEQKLNETYLFFFFFHI